MLAFERIRTGFERLNGNSKQWNGRGLRLRVLYPFQAACHIFSVLSLLQAYREMPFCAFGHDSQFVRTKNINKTLMQDAYSQI